MTISRMTSGDQYPIHPVLKTLDNKIGINPS